MSIYFMIYDENGKTGSGKKFYHNVILGADFAAQLYFVAIVMPVIQFCEGGLEVDENSAVLGGGSKPVSGLTHLGSSVSLHEASLNADRQLFYVALRVSIRS